MLEFKQGDLVEIDVRNTFADTPVWVPGVFHAYEFGKIKRYAVVRIEAPDGHPWARHNGMLMLSPLGIWIRSMEVSNA